MITVVLVDDDITILSVLENYIKWEKYNMRIIEAFSDSEEALDYLKKNQIQLVITDLVMPKITGIDLMAEVRKVNPQTAFIALSSYDEFKMVKNAFLNGAMDYFLKEDLDQDSFSELLKKMQIHCEKFQQTIISNEKYISNVISDMENIGNNEKILFTLFSCSLQQVQDILERCVKKNDNRFRIFELDGMLCVIHKSKMVESDIPWYQKIIHMSKFQDMYIASKKLEEDQSIGSLYYKTIEQLKMRQFMKKTGFPDMSYERHIKDPVITEYIAEMKKNCNKMQVNEAYIYLSRIMEYWAEADININTFLEKIISLMRLFFESFSYISNIIPCLKEPTYEDILYCKNITEVEEKVKRLTDELEKELKAVDGDEIIKIITAYIEYNFSDNNLTIKELAKIFYMSEGTLSRKFYLKNKVHLKEYLNAVRIERAKTLLLTTTISINGISQCVGYNNVEHFSRTFKKIVGMAPNMYREL